MEEKTSFIDGSFVKEIAELTRKEKHLFEINGKQYTNDSLKRVFDDPRPSKLSVNTLTGITDYIKNNIDEVAPGECLILVDSPEKVLVYGPVQGEKNDRHIILEAVLDPQIKQFSFNKWLEQEEFIISVLALFKETADREKIVDATSNMTAALTVAGEDDGSTMERKANSGVIVGGEKPPKVVNLKPYRTFPQVEQPESSFLFRYKKVDTAVAVALYEADGGAWRTDAIMNIKKFIEEQLPGCFIIS